MGSSTTCLDKNKGCFLILLLYLYTSRLFLQNNIVHCFGTLHSRYVIIVLEYLWTVRIQTIFSSCSDLFSST